ncbi:hypothetical protein PFISCL1PPCAC_5538, partial [Pristionchus fissidentatus]
MFRLLFVYFTFIAATSAECNEAQMNTIVKCYTDFNTAYGVKDFLPFPNYLEVKRFHLPRTNMLVEDGIAAKPTVMKYGAALTECLAPVAACIEDSTYYQAPLSCNQTADDGHSYNQDRLITSYESTEPGYSLQMRHYYCIDHFKNDD